MVSKRLTCLAVLAMVAAAHAGPFDDRQDRWIDNAEGLILQTPPGATVQERPTDETLVQFTGPPGDAYVIRVLLQYSPEIDLNVALKTAINEVKFTQLSMKVADQRIERGDPYDVGWVYCAVPDRPRNPAQWHRRLKQGAKPEPWVFGRAFVPIGNGRLVQFQLSVDADRFDNGRAVFERVYKSLQVRDPQVMVEQRRRLIDAGIKAWQTITPELMEKSLVPEQLFRIIAEGRDVGYMAVRQLQTSQMQVEGIQVEMQSRVIEGNRAIDTQSHFFLSWDGRTEVWSIRITDRPMAGVAARGGPDAREMTFAETGLRANGLISVKRDGISGLKKFYWPTPPQGYLSVVEAALLGQLLAHHDGDTEMGFYAYAPGIAKVTLRTDQFERLADGSYRVTTRPTPEGADIVSLYDPRGRLLKQDLPQNREMIPTTKQQISALWKVR